MTLNQYRLPENHLFRSPQSGQKERMPKLTPPFIMGPLPLVWFQEVMKLRGAALAVAIILWYYRGLAKSLTFKIGTQDIANHIGHSMDTAQRGLQELEEHGFITVERHPGRKHIVTIQVKRSQHESRDHQNYARTARPNIAGKSDTAPVSFAESQQREE